MTKCKWVTVSFVRVAMLHGIVFVNLVVIKIFGLSHIITVESYCISWTIRYACLPAKYCTKFSCSSDLKVNKIFLFLALPSKTLMNLII